MALQSRFYGTVVLLLALGAVSSATRAQVSSPALDLNETTIDALQDALRSRRVACRQIIEHYLRRIEAYDKRGPALNAVVSLNPRARAEADRLDATLRATGPAGPLHCVSVLVKDQLETADMPTTFGSVTFKSFTPTRDATVVARLRAAGAIIIGKATMGEFALGYPGSISGPIRNPYDPRRHAKWLIRGDWRGDRGGLRDCGYRGGHRRVDSWTGRCGSRRGASSDSALGESIWRHAVAAQCGHGGADCSDGERRGHRSRCHRWLRPERSGHRILGRALGEQ